MKLYSPKMVAAQIQIQTNEKKIDQTSQI